MIKKSLSKTNPELLNEWDYEKNNILGIYPESISPGSKKKVWWKLIYKDPNSKKIFTFNWTCSVYDRTKGSQCPYLTGNKIYPGFNDLATTHPQLIKEWDYEKNKNLKPWQVSKGSEKKVWWKCKWFGHSWSATVYNRVHGSLCPICRRELHVSFPEAAIYFYFHQVYPNAKWRMPFVGRYELDIYLPEKKIAIEYDGNEHHQSAVASEREKIKNTICLEHGITLYRIRQNVPTLHDSSIDIILEDEKRDTFAEALRNLIYTISGKYIQIDFAADESDIYELFYQRVKDNSLQKINPGLAKEWHPIKNSSLTPEMVTSQSGKNIWWMLSYDDAKTGKHFDFEWQAKICNRARGAACPYLVNKKVWTGYNDLQTIDPELAKEWHPVKNGDLKPTNILPGSNKKVWWLLPYDDPETGKHFDFEWQSSVNSRHRGAGCPFLSKSGQAVWTGYNDLATTHPKLLSEWDYEKNNAMGVTPDSVTAGSHKKIWWIKKQMNIYTKKLEISSFLSPIYAQT